jgi:hypothetical protein
MALPAICVDSPDTSPAAWPSLRFQQSTPCTIVIPLRNTDGSVFVLDDTTDTVRLTVLESPSVRTLFFRIDGTVADDAAGEISFSPLATDIPSAGIGAGEITIRRSGAVLRRFRCYAEVEIALEDYDQRNLNPLTVAEVRAATRDRSLEDNPLLQRVEFTDSEVMWSVIRAVERFNEYGDTSQSYTVCAFPYRTLLMEGALGELFGIAALNLTRNRMTVQSAGVQMDDSQRVDVYLKLSELYRERFQTTAIGIKRGNSWKAWMGSTNTPSFG